MYFIERVHTTITVYHYRSSDNPLYCSRKPPNAHLRMSLFYMCLTHVGNLNFKPKHLFKCNADKTPGAGNTRQHQHQLTKHSPKPLHQLITCLQSSVHGLECALHMCSSLCLWLLYYMWDVVRVWCILLWVFVVM